MDNKWLLLGLGIGALLLGREKSVKHRYLRNPIWKRSSEPSRQLKTSLAHAPVEWDWSTFQGERNEFGDTKVYVTGTVKSGNFFLGKRVAFSGTRTGWGGRYSIYILGPGGGASFSASGKNIPSAIDNFEKLVTTGPAKRKHVYHKPTHTVSIWRNEVTVGGLPGPYYGTYNVGYWKEGTGGPLKGVTGGVTSGEFLTLNTLEEAKRHAKSIYNKLREAGVTVSLEGLATGLIENPRRKYGRHR